jgi:hypothetical protein
VGRGASVRIVAGMRTGDTPGNVAGSRRWQVILLSLFFERVIAKKVCTTCSRTSYRIVPLTNLNKYLYSGKSEIKVEINNSSEKF